MGGVQCLNLFLQHPNSDCVEFKKEKKKGKKRKIAFFKKYFFILACSRVGNSSAWGLIRVEKIIWDRCARQKIFLTFCRQLRCAIFEISLPMYNYSEQNMSREFEKKKNFLVEIYRISRCSCFMANKLFNIKHEQCEILQISAKKNFIFQICVSDILFTKCIIEIIY